MGLIGKSVVVTGGGSGVGRAVAVALAKEGMKVLAVGRRRDKLAETASLADAGAIQIEPADVGREADAERVVSMALALFGRLDVLVNNAGANIRDRAVEILSVADFDKLIAINLRGAFLMMRAALEPMRTQKDGLIINISSIAGVRASPLGGAAYTASKHGLQGLSGVVSIEESRHGIRSTTICPGEINTPILDERPEPVSAERRAIMLQPEDVAAAVLFVTRLPARAHVPELVIKPTTQEFA